jgi:cyanophycin synthetase
MFWWTEVQKSQSLCVCPMEDEWCNMELWRLRVLSGPNIWAACPVLEASVELNSGRGASPGRNAENISRIISWLPELTSELDPSDESLDLAHVLERLTLQLQIRAGHSVKYAQTRRGNRPGRYRVAVEYQQEAVGRACLQTALDICLAAGRDQPFALAEEQARLQQLAGQLQLGPSTRALVEAARARNIPVDHFHPADGRYLLLGQGSRQRRSLAAQTEESGSLSRLLTLDRQLTRQLLREVGASVLVERPRRGVEHRLLVVEDGVVAALRLEGSAHDRRPPENGRRPDLCERIHPEVAACAVAAVKALRLRVAGVAVVAEDLGRPLEEQGGGIVEIHTDPDLGLPPACWDERLRPVGVAILNTLFPPGCEGRIPVVAIAGSRAREAGRCLAALLTDAGQRVGRASQDGVFLAGRKICLESATSHEKARAVLRNSLVDVAVLETSAVDLLRGGFGCDRCDVVLLTDLPQASENDTPLATDPDDSTEEGEGAFDALFRALAAHGRAVLNMDDPPLLRPLLPSAERIVWFSADGDNPRLADHRAAGGTAVFLCADSLVVARGGEEQRLPFGGRPVEREPHEHLALLAALAGAMAMNLCGDEKPAARTPARQKREPSLVAV